MTLPSAATKVHLDAATDDPKQARAELASLVDRFNDTLTHLNLSAVTSTPYAVGNGLEVSGSNIVVKPNTTNGSLVDVTSSGVRVGYADANSLQWPLSAWNNNTGANSAAGLLLHINKTNMNAGIFCGDGYAQITTGVSISKITTRAQTHSWANQADTTEYMRITSAGNVGIGTSTPPGRLTSERNISITTPGTGGSDQSVLDFYTLTDGSSGFGSANVRGWHNFARGNSYSVSAEQNVLGWFYWNGTSFLNAMSLSPTGNVGIGTLGPNQKLTVAGTIESTTGGVKFPDGTTQTTAATSSTITLGTAIATTSGSSHEFAGLPSGIDRLVFMIDKISCNGVGTVYVQLGTGGSIVTTGYECVYHDDAPATVTNTTGFQINDAAITNDIVTGQIVFHRVTGNTWIGTGIITGDNSGTVYVAQTSGRIALAGALDRVRIVNASSNSFDAGQVNIQYQD